MPKKFPPEFKRDAAPWASFLEHQCSPATRLGVTGLGYTDPARRGRALEDHAVQCAEREEWVHVGKLPALWVYKCNAVNHRESIAFGSWEHFFAQPQPTEWGGSMTMASKQSLRILWKEMQPGDLVLCWQTDKRQAVGLGRVHSLPESVEDDGTPRREMWLELLGEPFSPPLPLLDMRKEDPELAAVRCFRAGYPSTLYGTTEAEAKTLLRACGVTPRTLEALLSARRRPRAKAK